MNGEEYKKNLGLRDMFINLVERKIKNLIMKTLHQVQPNSATYSFWKYLVVVSPHALINVSSSACSDFPLHPTHCTWKSNIFLQSWDQILSLYFFHLFEVPEYLMFLFYCIMYQMTSLLYDTLLNYKLFEGLLDHIFWGFATICS